MKTYKMLGPFRIKAIQDASPSFYPYKLLSEDKYGFNKRAFPDGDQYYESKPKDTDYKFKCLGIRKRITQNGAFLEGQCKEDKKHGIVRYIFPKGLWSVCYYYENKEVGLETKFDSEGKIMQITDHGGL